MDHLLPQLELKYERHQLECQSPTHLGERRVWTTFHPRKSRRFFCDACRAEFAGQKQDAQREFVNTTAEGSSLYDAVDSGGKAGLVLSGVVKKKDPSVGSALSMRIMTDATIFFILPDLRVGLDFNELEEGALVEFQVKREPSVDKAGAACEVRKSRATLS